MWNAYGIVQFNGILAKQCETDIFFFLYYKRYLHAWKEGSVVKSPSKNPEFSFKHHVRHLTTIWFCLNEMVHPLLSPVGICVVVTCTHSYTQIIQLKKTILVAFNYSSNKMLNYVVCILFKNYNSLIKGIESLLLSMPHEQWEHKKWMCVWVCQETFKDLWNGQGRI